MRHHCFSKTKNRHIFNCPIKRPSHSKDKHIFIHHINECPLGALCDNSKMGPTISIDRSINLKFYPEIPRDSSIFKKLQNKLHHAEANHDSAKNDYKLNQQGRGHRKADYYLIRYYAVSIVVHSKAWLPDDNYLVKNNATNFVFGS